MFVKHRSISLELLNGGRRQLGERGVGRREHGVLTAVERLDQIDLRVELPDSAEVKVVSIGLFAAASVTGTIDMPCTDAGPVGLAAA